MRRTFILIGVIAAAIFVAPSTRAHVDIADDVLCNGGGMSSNENAVLFVTAGQPSIGLQASDVLVIEAGILYSPWFMITGIEDGCPGMIEAYRLDQNFPNPFNPATTIRFFLPERSRVTLKLYDVLGREVTTLVDEEMERGTHDVVLTAKGLASGVYFYRIAAGGFSRTRKLILLR